MSRSLLALLVLAAATSLQAADEPRVDADIAYSTDGDDRNLTSLDVYAPASGSQMPVMLWVHGGGWTKGDKARVGAKPRAFNDHGMVLVSVNYRLQPAVDFRAQAGDLARAIRWTHDHAADYGASPQKIFIMGHSAGAHLAALVATDGRYLDAECLKLNVLRGVVLLDGAAYDIPWRMANAPLPRMKEAARKLFTDDPDTQKDASPISHVARDKGIPPFLILHVADRRDSRLLSERLAQRLTESGIEARVIAAKNKTHGTINTEFGADDDPPTRETFEFLARCLKVND